MAYTSAISHPMGPLPGLILSDEGDRPWTRSTRTCLSQMHVFAHSFSFCEEHRAARGTAAGILTYTFIAEVCSDLL